MTKTLLPAGCYDVLPPEAARDAALRTQLLSTFAQFGYAQVAPPLLEYTESLLAGRGAALSKRVFRVMDPDANKVMGIRADMTLQVARIAATTLADSPRPLRLSYAGLIVRTQKSALEADRQRIQTGIELIGLAPDAAGADAEVMLVAAEALFACDIPGISIDIHLPGFVPALLAEEVLAPEEIAEVMHAVAQKDAAALAAYPLRCREILAKVMQIFGPADAALAKLSVLSLPAAAKAMIAHAKKAIHLLEPLLAGRAELTFDITESYGFEYHTGLGFSLFSRHTSQELGRGGRYRIEGSPQGLAEATGFTLYLDSLRPLAPAPKEAPRVLVAAGVGETAAHALRAKGYATIYALSDTDLETQARAQHCAHIFVNGKLTSPPPQGEG